MSALKVAAAGALVLLAVSACRPDAPPPAGEAGGSDPWEEARRRGIEFRALGQEPGWFLEIDEGRSMHLVYDYLEREATTPAPTLTRDGTRTVYSATNGSQSLTVTIEQRECHDIMSGFGFPATVIVIIDGRELRGCGRDL